MMEIILYCQIRSVKPIFIKNFLKFSGKEGRNPMGCGILSEPPRGATWVAPTGGACSVAVTNINIMRRRQRLATSKKLVKAKDHYWGRRLLCLNQEAHIFTFQIFQPSSCQDAELPVGDVRLLSLTAWQRVRTPFSRSSTCLPASPTMEIPRITVLNYLDSHSLEG